MAANAPARITFVSPVVGNPELSRHRAGRIPEEIWEQYDSDIIREHALGGLRGVQAWINAQGIDGFEPSERQIRYRIEKIQRKQPDNFAGEQAIGRPSEITAIPQDGDASANITNRSVEDLVAGRSDSREDKELVPSLQTFHSRSISPPNVPVPRTAEGRRREALSDDEVGPLLKRRKRAVHFESDLLMALSSRLGSLLKDIRLSWKADQINALLATPSANVEYPKEDLEVISDAADFFLRTTNGEIAFPLYLTLWLTGWQPEGKRKRDFLLACAATASIKSDVNIVRGLLRARIEEEEKSNSGLYDRLLLRIALFVITLNMSEAANTHTMSRLSDDLSGFFDGYWKNEIELDVPGYITICQILRLTSIGRQEVETLELIKSFESRFIEQTPGPFVLRHGELKNTCLRCCLDWCLERLKNAFQLPKDWKTLHQKSIDKGWSNFIAVFWFLWTQWHQSKNEERPQASWYEDREMVMGLSTTELLSDITSFILSVTPERSRAGPRQDADVDFQQRIVRGAEILSMKSDKELASMFLQQCFKEDGWVYPEDGNHSEILTIATRVFLAGRAASDGCPSNQFTAVRTGGLENTLATSYTTSTLSSMARQAASRWRNLSHSFSSRLLKVSRKTVTEGLTNRVGALSLSDEDAAEREVETKHWIEAFLEESGEMR